MIGVTTAQEEVIVRRQRPARYIKHPSAGICEISTIRANPHLLQDHIPTREVVVAVTAAVVTKHKIVPRSSTRDIDRPAGLIDRASAIITDHQALGGGDRQRVPRADRHDSPVVCVVTQVDRRRGDTPAGSKVHLAGVDLHRAGEGVAGR